MLQKMIRTSFFLFFAIVLTAQPSLDSDNFEKKRQDLSIHQKLQLTESQRDEIGKIKEETQSKVIDMEYELKKTKLSLRKMIKQDNFEEAKKNYNKTLEIEKQIKELKFNESLKIYGLLDSKQKELFIEFIINRHQKKLPFDKHIM
ncbi:MAG TPA: hypothetical protein PL041_04615 [Melioribacteraceae bacterium]|nr:hypothetical protein [Melioribacteraceae bacterium]